MKILNNLKGELKEQPKENDMLLQLQCLSFNKIYIVQNIGTVIDEGIEDNLSDGKPTPETQTNMKQTEIFRMRDQIKGLHVENESIKVCIK